MFPMHFPVAIREVERLHAMLDIAYWDSTGTKAGHQEMTLIGHKE